MPLMPRSGAQILPISLVSPAFYGLNKQAESSILGPEWCTEAYNCVFDSSGRLAARKGWLGVTTTPITSTPVIEQIAELRKEDGTTQIVVSANSKLWLGTATFSDITGTATVTAGNNWQFVNFNNNLYGVQQGEAPIVYTGTGAFADLSAASGSVPTGNCALAYAGRLWVADSDRQTLKYSALLDATHWSTGAGSVDLTSVWPNGADEIVALKAFNNRLIILGKNSTIIYTDGTGSELGIDPTNMYVEDVLGLGCIARDSVQEVEGEDLLFLSAAGVISLQRLIQEKSAPTSNISKNNRNYVLESVSVEDVDEIRSEYSPENSFYILSLPTSELTFCFDTTGKLEDGSYRLTTWGIAPTALARAKSGDLYMTEIASPGELGTYSGYLDDEETYTLRWLSGWLDLGEELSSYLKILKNINATVFTGAQVSVVLKWYLDFQDTLYSSNFTTGESASAEYGIAEYGIAEYSGGIALNRKSISTVGSGQYIRLGLQTNVNSSPFSMQQITLIAKIGRLAK
jgi:hypothetical protein